MSHSHLFMYLSIYLFVWFSINLSTYFLFCHIWFLVERFRNYVDQFY